MEANRHVIKKNSIVRYLGHLDTDTYINYPGATHYSFSHHLDVRGTKLVVSGILDIMPQLTMRGQRSRPTKGH